MVLEYVIIRKPTEKEKKDGKLETMVVTPRTIVAKDQQHAGLIAIKDNVEQLGDDIANIEVLVRPFA